MPKLNDKKHRLSIVSPLLGGLGVLLVGLFLHLSSTADQIPVLSWSLLAAALVTTLLLGFVSGVQRGKSHSDSVTLALDLATNLSGVGYLHFFPTNERWVANHIAQALFRLPSRQFVAPPEQLLQRVHPNDLESARAALDAVLNKPAPVSGELQLGCETTGYTRVRYYAYRLADDSVAISLTDINEEKTARELAIQNEKRLQEVLRAARATRIEINPDTGEVLAPEQAREFLGLEISDDFDALIDNLSPEYRDDFRYRLNQGGTFEQVYPVVVAEGEVNWLRFSATPTSKGAINITLVDLTEQHASVFDQRVRLEQILAASKLAGLSIYTEHIEDGRVDGLYVNPEQQFEFCAGDALFLRVGSAYHQVLRDAQSSPGTVIEIPYIRDDGSTVWIRYSVLKERASVDLDLRTLLIQDITDLVSQRDEAQKSLERVSKVQQELQRRVDREHQMFAVIGHELRTPAASIKMLLDQMDLDASLPAVQTLADQVEHLLDVLDDVRILVNPDRAYQVRERTVALRPLVTRAIESLKPLAQEAKINVSFAADEGADREFRTKPQVLRQLMLNLIRNACFHSQGSRLNITLRTREIDELSTGVTIRFEDNGRGVPSSFQPMLFEPFHREDNQSQGMGLGLSICQTLIKKLEGRIRYEDAAGGGAVFILEFELTPAELDLEELGYLDNTEAQGGKEIDWSQMRVLVAEDNATIRMLTEKVLTTKGARVFVGEDGQKALERFLAHNINLVLTDIFMPTMDGYGLTEALRNHGFTGPIIGISAAVVGEETDRLVEAGADLVLSKPIKMPELEAQLQALADRIDLIGPASCD